MHVLDDFTRCINIATIFKDFGEHEVEFGALAFHIDLSVTHFLQSLDQLNLGVYAWQRINILLNFFHHGGYYRLVQTISFVDDG